MTVPDFKTVPCPKCGAIAGAPCLNVHPQNIHTLRATAFYKAATATAKAAKFVAVDVDVKQGPLTIARAVSKSMAKRVANALNKYTPDRRGQ